jgi:hypothetical protein
LSRKGAFSTGGVYRERDRDGGFALYAESMFKPSLKPQAEPAETRARRRPFEGVDLREAGRRGGQASGLSRRLRKQRQLEAKVLESRNGAAAVKLLEIQLRRDRELEKERIRQDAIVQQYRAQRSELFFEVEDLADERARLLAGRQALVRRNAELSAVLAAGEGELVDRLRGLHEAGGLVPVLEALDLLEAVPDDGEGDGAVQVA